jgi:hypothetical protein
MMSEKTEATTTMSAIRLPQPSDWRPLIVKLYHTTYTLDPFADRLFSHGYDVTNTNNYSGTLKAARESHPALIIVHDDLAGGVDAAVWVGMQHSDRDARLAMMPLIILADGARLPILRAEAQPDRVILLQNRADTLNQLTRTVKRTLRVWELDQPPA